MLIPNFHMLAKLVHKIYLDNNSRILLEHVDHGAGSSRVIVGTTAAKHGLGHAHRLVDV
jgi:hypothetical protein